MSRLARIIPVSIGLAVLALGMAMSQSPSQPEQNREKVTLEESKLAGTEDSFTGTDLEPFDVESAATAQVVLSALKRGYPSKISAFGYDEEAQDWFILVGTRKFLWAKGRLLPQAQARSARKWRPYVDYLYPWEVPNPETFSQKLIEELKRISEADHRASQPPYNLEFFDSLYDGKTRTSMERHIVSTHFLGKRVNLHRDIVPSLAAVEERIREEAQRNPKVRDFIRSIGRVEGYNWREIRGRQDRSFHSWGIALDILPTGWQQKNIYWRWLSDRNPDWMLIPLEHRWIPPQEVVSIFERYGFVWGGKWLQWDNIHFEYRPELIILRRR